MALVKLIPLDQCRQGGGTFVERRDAEYAVFVFPDTGEVIVTDNACPHASGNLAGGEVAGRTVTCPWHHWEFDLDSGQCTHSPRASVRRYTAEVKDGHVWVDLPDG